jgi:hypothetical protein
MSIVDDAIDRLQTIALSCTTVKIKGAPSKPVSDAMVLPLAIAYIAEGSGSADDATTARLLLTVNVDFHFDRMSLKSAYTEINKLIPEYLQRLAGDPTLNGKVDTIIFPVTFNVSAAAWDKVTTQMVSFKIPLKFIESPTT